MTTTRYSISLLVIFFSFTIVTPNSYSKSLYKCADNNGEVTYQVFECPASSLQDEVKISKPASESPIIDDKKYNVQSCLSAIKNNTQYTDPDSVKIEWAGEKRMELIDYLGKKIRMYVIKIKVNAKNKFGGYTGAKLHACDYSVHTGNLIQTR